MQAIFRKQEIHWCGEVSTDVYKFIDSAVAAVWEIQPLFILCAVQTHMDVLIV